MIKFNIKEKKLILLINFIFFCFSNSDCRVSGKNDLGSIRGSSERIKNPKLLQINPVRDSSSGKLSLNGGGNLSLSSGGRRGL